MTVTEIIKDITVQDEFFEKLNCQNELLASLWVDKPNTYIMACMSKGDDIFKVLRLICIHCVANNGFKVALLETYKREIVRAYGFKYFDLLNNMEKSGILFLQTQKVFNTISQKMNLLVDNVNEENPNDISYVFSGYAPLSVRFCQFLTRPTWKAYGDLFGLLPGQFFEETQRLPSGVRRRSKRFISLCFFPIFVYFFFSYLLGNSNTSIHSSQSVQSIDQKMTLVFFIGGCTYAEVSAFRYLSESNESKDMIFLFAITLKKQ